MTKKAEPFYRCRSALELYLPSRRSVVSGLVASGSTLALAGLAAPTACAQSAGPEGLIRSSDFGSFRDAVAHWSRTGGTLIINADYQESAPVTMNCVRGKSYRLTSEGRRTISYVGPHYHWLFCIYSEGENSFIVDGDLTFDGRNNCSIPFFARFEGVSGGARRDFLVSGLNVMNARMKQGISRFDGSPANAYGSTGMLFGGGFDDLRLTGVRASNITREAGAGRAGSQGCVGIGVVADLSGTHSARHVTIQDFEVANVNGDDAVGNPERLDMDGVLVFQSPEVGGSRPVIQRGTVREAAGRAIKVFAPGGGGTTRNIEIHRSVHGNTNGSNDLAHQHGDGDIEDITFHYSGNAHSQPTIPIGLSSGSTRQKGFPFRAGVVRNIAINDTTGKPKRAIATVFFNERDATPRRYVFQNIRDTGIAQHLVLPGALGTFGDALIEIDQVSVNLTGGLIATEDYSRRLRVVAHRLVNRNRRAVPFKVFYDGRGAPRGHGGELIADSTVSGVSF